MDFAVTALCATPSGLVCFIGPSPVSQFTQLFEVQGVGVGACSKINEEACNSTRLFTLLSAPESLAVESSNSELAVEAEKQEENGITERVVLKTQPVVLTAEEGGGGGGSEGGGSSMGLAMGLAGCFNNGDATTDNRCRSKVVPQIEHKT